MMVSSKGRYAMRLVIDLAQHTDAGTVSLKEISDRQEVSLKYLESIASMLHKGGIIKSVRGKEGGYLLAKPASKISVQEIMSITEGSLAPVSCLEENGSPCGRSELCLTFPLWQKLDGIIESYLSEVSIQDLIDRRI